MNILYVVHDFFPRYYGGTERYVLNLAKQMQRMGHFVSVLTYGLEEPIHSYPLRIEDIFYKTYVFEDISVISVRHRLIPAEIGCIIEDPPMRAAIREIIRDIGFNIMHIAHPMRMPSFQAGKDLGIPVLLTLTDFWLLCPRGRFYKPDYSLCNSPESGIKCANECGASESILSRYHQAKELFDNIDLILSPSRLLIEIYRANGWKRDLFHLNHGVDYHYVKHIHPAKSDDDTVVFGYIGVVTKFKGVDLLIKSFMNINSPKIRLNIWGNTLWEPDFDSELEWAVKTDSRIKLMGRYDHGDLWKVMSGIDVMVVPSSTLESFGLVVVESLAYGIPVIASNIVGAGLEYIENGKNGYIFPIASPETLTDIMRKIALDRDAVHRLKRHITRPPQIEEEAFEVELLYKKLLGHKFLFC